VQRFSQVIQFKTVSDLSTSNHARYPEEFSKLDAFLQASYPGTVLCIAAAAAAAAPPPGQQMLHARVYHRLLHMVPRNLPNWCIVDQISSPPFHVYIHIRC
jgi:hypothetical protein